MLSDIVIPGQIVEIQEVRERQETPPADDTEEKKVYRTKVYDVNDEERLELMMPIEKGRLILLEPDEEYSLCFYTANGLYQCYARVTDRYKSDNIYIVVMELSSSLRKHQRREYYRLPCALGMESRKLDREEVKAVEKRQAYLVPGQPMKSGIIVDISGGGLRFVGDFAYEERDLICCSFSLVLKSEEKYHNLIGKVLSVREIENKRGSYEHRVQYVNLDVDDREEIIRYIFQEERKRRHKLKSM